MYNNELQDIRGLNKYSFYKLTWKQSFPKEINGKPTFYGMLLDGKLKKLA